MFSRIVVLLCCVLSSVCFADTLTLDANKSSLYFLSVKNDKVVEIHNFVKLSGNVVDEQATLAIDLSSVETHIELRNQRMREMLFNVAKNAQAQVSVKLDTLKLDALKLGESKIEKLPVTVSLNGQQKVYQQDLRIAVLKGGAFQVSTEQPLLIDSADFALTGGIDALRDIAKLTSILPVVPVVATLVYKK